MRDPAAAAVQREGSVSVLGVVSFCIVACLPLLAVLLGLAVVTNFKGFADLHRQGAQASTPEPLHQLSDHLVGQARNEKATRGIHKAIGWVFLIGGIVMTIALIVSVITALA
jgi:hypothetical protein